VPGLLEAYCLCLKHVLTMGLGCIQSSEYSHCVLWVMTLLSARWLPTFCRNIRHGSSGSVLVLYICPPTRLQPSAITNVNLMLACEGYCCMELGVSLRFHGSEYEECVFWDVAFHWNQLPLSSGCKSTHEMEAKGFSEIWIIF